MSDRREALLEAMAQHEEAEPAPAPEVAEVAPSEAPALGEAPTEVVESTEATPPKEGRDEKGRFAPKAKDAAPPADGATATPVTPSDKQAAVAPNPVAPAAEALKPPQSWKAQAREEWAKLSPAVQAEVHRREVQAAVEIKAGGDARAFQEQFQRHTAPFEAHIRARGGDPMANYQGLIQTQARLMLGTPQDKASVVAEIIRGQGIDPGMVAQLLEGQPAGGGQQPQQPQQGQYQDPRVDQLLAHIQQQEERQKQAETQRYQQQVDEFSAKAEFFSDVEADMADLLSLAHKRGLKLSLQDAYNKAVAMLPEDSEPKRVLKQREAAKLANASQASTLRARAAASSVKNQPAAGVSNGAPGVNDRRAALLAAAAAHSRNE